MILKSTNLLALLLSEAWFIKQPDWEPAILFIGFLSNLIIQEIKSKNLKNDNLQDKELFKNLLNELPSNEGSINFLREHDFHNSFKIDKLDQIRIFARNWDNAEYGFLNKKLENLRTELLNLIYEFIDVSSHHTFPLANGFQTAIPRYTDNHKIPEKAKEMIKRMNQLGDSIFIKHQELIREAKKTLNV